jgi:hypothetical protein
MKKIKSQPKIDIKYEYVETENSEERLSDIFDFIFTETCRIINNDKKAE